MPKKSYAQIGYEAYGDNCAWKNYQGNPMPLWDDLPKNIQDNWDAAAIAIIDQRDHDV